MRASFAPGTIVEARLIDVGRHGRNAVALADGEEYLLPDAPRRISEGAMFDLVVTRSRIPGAEPWKRPLGRVADPASVGNEGRGSTVAMPAEDQLGAAGWNDLLEEARSGIVRFAGGELRIEPTPAMTLIDVDGFLAPDELACRRAAEAAKAIRRLDIGGSIGIDLPTPARRRRGSGPPQRSTLSCRSRSSGRRSTASASSRSSGRASGASLVELAQDRAAVRSARRCFGARRSSRRGPNGSSSIRRSSPCSKAMPDWLEALARQIGGAVGLRADPAVPMSGGYAEPA